MFDLLVGGMPVVVEDAVHKEGGPAVQYKLDREFRVQIPVDVPAGGFQWFVIK